MAEIGAVAATVAVIRGAIDALRGLRDQGLSAEHARAVDDAMDLMRDAQDRVNTLQAALIEVREENYGLRRQIDEHDNWNTRLSEFNLVATPGGAHVYQRGTEGSNLYACPACIENHQIQFLQNMKAHSGHWRCPSCTVEYPVDPYTPMEPMSFESPFDA